LVLWKSPSRWRWRHIIYIIEGVEHSGKTTFIEQFQQLTHFPAIDPSSQFTKKLRDLAYPRITAESYFATTYLLAKQHLLPHDILLHHFYPTREIYKKYFPREELIKVQPEELPPHTIVLLTCTETELKHRARHKNEDFDPQTLAIQNDLIKYVSNLNGDNILKFIQDTTHLNPHQYKDIAYQIKVHAAYEELRQRATRYDVLKL
jgi:hypothetical protein